MHELAGIVPFVMVQDKWDMAGGRKGFFFNRGRRSAVAMAAAPAESYQSHSQTCLPGVA